jgi:archaellum component FlaD/FlaE
MEWMQFLVSAGGPLGATRALRLYEDFGWISPSVRSTLDTYARSVASPSDDAQNGSLTAGHHETSLSYVSRLGDRTPETSALDALVADGGGHDGLRR